MTVFTNPGKREHWERHGTETGEIFAKLYRVTMVLLDLDVNIYVKR